MAWTDSMGGMSGKLIGYMTTTAFWLIFMIGVIIFGVLVLVIRKRRKMNKTVLECIDLGDGRMDYVLSKGGWFKNRFTLMGLWDYGTENRFRMKDMTPVDNVSHNDYRMINGKLGVVVIRNPHDNKMVFPISRSWLSRDSKQMMMQVAPADYRDSASKSIEQADLEMQSKWQQYAPLIIVGLVIIIALVITVLNTQYGKYMVDKSLALIQEIKTTPCGSMVSTAAP